MDWAEFIATESHSIPLEKAIKLGNRLVVIHEGAQVEVILPATIPARGESMSNFTKVVQSLKEERDQAQRRIEQLDEALKALTGLGVRGTARRRGPAQESRKRRTMSVAARKRIAAAQRARWARWKVARRSK
jgi:ABC-type proline/glycine betaine transport system ATPase subunit